MSIESNIKEHLDQELAGSEVVEDYDIGVAGCLVAMILAGAEEVMTFNRSYLFHE